MTDRQAAARNLADQLSHLYEEAGTPSVRQLAARTNVSHTTVHRTLRGEGLEVIRWATLCDIVQALNGEPDDYLPLWQRARQRPAIPKPSYSNQIADLERRVRALEQAIVAITASRPRDHAPEGK